MSMLRTSDREALGRIMDLLLADEPQVHYPVGDVRTQTVHQIGTVKSLRAVLDGPHGLTCDCSQFVQLVFHVAGCADPMGRSYRMDGFTGTLLEHLPGYADPRIASLGAIVIFGPGKGDHTALVRHPDHAHGNPGLVSHGQERGPLVVSLKDEAAAHRAPVRFLNVSQLGL